MNTRGLEFGREHQRTQRGSPLLKTGIYQSISFITLSIMLYAQSLHKFLSRFPLIPKSPGQTELPSLHYYLMCLLLSVLCVHTSRREYGRSTPLLSSTTIIIYHRYYAQEVSQALSDHHTKGSHYPTIDDHSPLLLVLLEENDTSSILFLFILIYKYHITVSINIPIPVSCIPLLLNLTDRLQV